MQVCHPWPRPGVLEKHKRLSKPHGRCQNAPVPNWLIKSAIQRAISVLPKPHLWNEVFQKFVTKSLELPPAEFVRKAGQCATHLDHLLGLQPERSGRFTVLEVGTGWYPAMPVGFF